MCSIAYEPCDENSFKIGPPVAESKSVSSLYSRLRYLYNQFEICSFADDVGSGDGENGGIGTGSLGPLRECSDRVLMPCDSEEFITVSILELGWVLIKRLGGRIYKFEYYM